MRHASTDSGKAAFMARAMVGAAVHNVNANAVGIALKRTKELAATSYFSCIFRGSIDLLPSPIRLLQADLPPVS
jgi:hypothetical protein